MASASSKRTLDTDYITLRKIFAKVSDNRPVVPNYVLASVGDGTTYWAQPSTLGGLPTFSEVQLDSTAFIGTNGLRSLQLSASNGILLSTSLSIPSSLQILGTNFSYLDVSGVSSIYAFSNFLLNNSLFLASEGFLSTSTRPSENTVTIASLRQAPALSTNIVSFQSLKVLSTLVSPTDVSLDPGNMIWSKTDATSFPVFVGIQDFVFRNNFVSPILGLELSSYSAQAFLSLSTVVATSFLSTLSSISSLYTQTNIFSTALTSLSTTERVYVSTNLSTTFGVSNYTQLTYNQKFGDTMARATIIQLNDQFGILNTGVSTISSFKTPVYIMLSTNQGFINSYSTPASLSTSTFLDFTAGSIFNFTVNGLNAVSTQLSTLSTSIGSNIFTMAAGVQGKIPPFLVSTASTFQQLGSIGYVSSVSLQSTVRSLGSEGYISTASLRSSVEGVALTLPSSQTLATAFVSTTNFIRETAPYISTFTLQSSILSTTSGLFSYLGDRYVSSAGLKDTTLSTTKGIIEYASQFSYISSLTFTSTLISSVSSLYTLYPTEVFLLSSLNSTVQGGPFVSPLQLQSTLNGLGQLNYISSQSLQSTTDSFLNLTKVFVSSLTIPTNLLRQTVTMTNVFQSGSNADLYNQYFSSLVYPSLANFSKQCVNATNVHIQYTPTILFSPVRLGSNATTFFPISTGIQIGPRFIPETLYQETIALNSVTESVFSYSGASNVYSKQLHFQLTTSEFLSAESNGFAIVHLIQNSNVPFAFPPFYILDTQAGIYTSPSNALFISIYN